jgi:predicted patatin/cPLA2 family phospholipase
MFYYITKQFQLRFILQSFINYDQPKQSFIQIFLFLFLIKITDAHASFYCVKELKQLNPFVLRSSIIPSSVMKFVLVNKTNYCTPVPVISMATT